MAHNAAYFVRGSLRNSSMYLAFSRFTVFVVGLSMFGPSPLRAAEPAKRPPNVVYFIIDELGYYELSHMGHPDMRTPNIDRLAAEGIRFTQCLAGSAVCAPTRCCLMT